MSKKSNFAGTADWLCVVCREYRIKALPFDQLVLDGPETDSRQR